MKKIMQKITKGWTFSKILRFPLIPLKEQRAIYTFYTFYNHLKNVAESVVPNSQKKELIELWRQEIDNIYDKKKPVSKLGKDIYKNCMRFKLPKQDLISILDSVEMVFCSSFKVSNTEKLNQYCKGMAGAPSSMLLRILGCKDKKLINELSENMGQAVEITDILRNIRDDAEAGKLYIPDDFLKDAGIKATNPKEIIVDKNLNIARQELAQIAEKKYEKTFNLIEKLDKKISRNIKIPVYVYKKYFDLMNNRGWEIISPKPKIGYFSKLFLILKAYSGK